MRAGFTNVHRLCLVLLLQLSTSENLAYAETVTIGGRLQKIRVFWNIVAIPQLENGSGGFVAPRELPEKIALAFWKEGIAFRRYNEPPVDLPHYAIGNLIQFNDNIEALAVLTPKIVVKVKEGSRAKFLEHMAKFDDVTVASIPFLNQEFLISTTTPREVFRLMPRIKSHASVVYIHPHYLIPKLVHSQPSVKKTTIAPTDPLISASWHLENTGKNPGSVKGADAHIKAAWELSQGNRNTVIAVLDLGFEGNHPDLASTWYRNPGEISGNSQDDDDNGLVDDVSGWNFSKDSGDINDGRENYHGTAVAGILGAPLNGIGGAGACPGCSVLPIIVAIDPVKDASAFLYASKMGAAVISCSWGYAYGVPVPDIVSEAINQVAIEGRDGLGSLIVFAMPNLGIDACSGNTPDIAAEKNVVAVAGATDQDLRVSNSAFGACLGLLAPTGDEGRPAITTTDLVGQRGLNTGHTTSDLPDINYTNSFAGTSAATPIVAGTLGLMISQFPEITRAQAISALYKSADKIQPRTAAYNRNGFSKTYGHGRINAATALSTVVKMKNLGQLNPKKSKLKLNGKKVGIITIKAKPHRAGQAHVQ